MQTKPLKQISKFNPLGVLTKLFRHDRLLSVKEAAELIGRDEKIIYYHIRVKNLPSEEYHGKLLVKETDLEFLKK